MWASVSDLFLHTGAAFAGQGIIQVLRYRIQSELEQGRLLEIFPDNPSPLPVSAVMTRSRQLSPRVRVFVDWLVECFEGAFD